MWSEARSTKTFRKHYYGPVHMALKRRKENMPLLEEMLNQKDEIEGKIDFKAITQFLMVKTVNGKFYYSLD